MLVEAKIDHYLKTATSLESESIGKEITNRYSSQNFEFAKPIAVNSEETAEQSLPSELDIQENSADYLNGLLLSNPYL